MYAEWSRLPAPVCVVACVCASVRVCARRLLKYIKKCTAQRYNLARVGPLACTVLHTTANTRLCLHYTSWLCMNGRAGMSAGLTCLHGMWPAWACGPVHGLH